MTLPGVPALRLVHGLPGNFFVGFRPDSPPDWAARRLAGVAQDIIAGGHTHVVMARRIPKPAGGAWLVVNSGSAGVSYDGDPRASYIWLAGDRQGWQAEIRRVDYDRAVLEQGFRVSTLAAKGGVLGEMFLRSALTGQPWVADFMWWVRQQFGDEPTDIRVAQQRYEASHGPDRWAFPLAA